MQFLAYAVASRVDQSTFGVSESFLHQASLPISGEHPPRATMLAAMIPSRLILNGISSRFFTMMLPFYCSLS